MAADEWDDDDWGEKPTPMTAIAIRLEVDAVDAVRELAGDVPPAELLRRWVLERLSAERTPVEPAPAPAKKRAPARKKAAPKPAKKVAKKPAKRAAKKRA